MNGEIDADVSEIVDGFYSVFSKPLTNATDFYTYYYLSEVEGKDNYNFELMKTSQEIADAFHNYAIYSCLREVRDMPHQVEVDDPYSDTVLYKDWRTDNADFIEKEMVSHAEEAGEKVVGEKAAKIAISGMLNRPTLDKGSIKNFCNEAERRLDAFSKPQEALKALEMVFNIDEIVDDGEVSLKWTYGYGGEAWESVASMAGRRPEFSDVAYTDLMWSVEHNNELFIDKVKVTEEEYSKLNSFATELSGAGGVGRAEIGREGMYDVLNGVLDDAREGVMYYIMKFTGKSDKRVRRELMGMQEPRESEFRERVIDRA